MNRNTGPIWLALGVVALLANGCGHDPDVRGALREARQSFTYQGKLIHPALVRHFIPYLFDPQDPVIRTVDVTAGSEADNAYSWEKVTIPKGEGKGLADIWYEYENEGTGPVTTPWFDYAFLGTLPDSVQVLLCFDCGGGSLTFHYLVFVQLRMDARGDLLMDVVAIHHIAGPVHDPVVLRSGRICIPARHRGQDSWDAYEVWLEKTRTGYEVRERAVAEALNNRRKGSVR